MNRCHRIVGIIQDFREIAGRNICQAIEIVQGFIP